MSLVDKYLLSELTKPQVFKGIKKVLGSNWMSTDEIYKKCTLPISKHGIEAHLDLLVSKGEVKETMQKGKYVYKLNESKSSKVAYDNPKTGETAYLYKKGKTWIIDTGEFDAERDSKKDALDQLKKWGFTKKVGIET